MTRLSDWIDLSKDSNIDVLKTLTKPKLPACGCYDHLTNAFSLLDKLDAAILDIPYPNRRPTILELRDIDIGTPSSVTNMALADLVSIHKLDPDTPVYLRYVSGGLALFILVDDVLTCPIKTNITTLAINPDDRSVWLARLGKFTPSNQVWGQSRFHGKVSPLQKTLKVPYLCTYTLVKSSDFSDDISDIPY